MTTPIIACATCKHLRINKKCNAFPTKDIPNDILTGDNDHTKKHPDQNNNIVFEKRKE